MHKTSAHSLSSPAMASLSPLSVNSWLHSFTTSGETRWRTRRQASIRGSRSIRTQGGGAPSVVVDEESRVWLQGLSWPITIVLADSGPPPMHKTCASNAQTTVNTISLVVSDISQEKWSEHGWGTDLTVHFSLLGRRPNSKLVRINYPRASIWYIYCLCLVRFVKSCIFRDKLWKLLV